MDIVTYFIQNHGYGRMKDLKKAGFNTRVISKTLEENIIEKIKPGLYKLIDYYWDENSIYRDIYRANSKAIICLNSALHYYNLATINPGIVQVAVPNNTARFSIDYPPVKVFYFSDTIYPIEIDRIDTANGSFEIYSIEKTICDVFRYRNKLGEDIALEALKNYLSRNDLNLTKLCNVATKCKVLKTIEPYIKALVI
ncbi:MAG: hypothetical protein P9L91_02730 [Candidatus Zophobacter franzmannii]|nr:hypothetical protein [Candidatus Zophobacter franzmannii]